MSLFDSVYVPCPHCGAKVEFQSKEGECYMDTYALENAPDEIMRDIINAPEHCMKCGNWLALVDPAFPPQKPLPVPRPTIVKVRTPDNPRVHSQGMQWWPDDHPFTYDDLNLPPEEGRG